MKRRAAYVPLAIAASGTFWLLGEHQALGRDRSSRPSAVLEKLCRQSDGVQVCAMNVQGRNLPQLQIIYSGYLANQDDNGVVVWVELNGRDGFFHMKKSETLPQYEVWLGAPVSETPCRIDDGGSSVPSPDEIPACPPGTPGRPGERQWIVEGPPDDEAVLFSQVKDRLGDPLPWSVQSAFVSEDGRRWDSKYGSNYRFTFLSEPRPDR